MKMQATWAGLAAALLLSAMPVWAGDNTQTKSTDDRLKQIDEKLDQMLKKVAEALEKQTTMQLQIQGLEARVQELERRLATTERRLYPQPVTTGSIRLENPLSQAATFVVNDRSYRVDPNRYMELKDFPAGTVTYRVLVDGYGEIQPPVTRTLRPGYVMTIFTYQP